MDITFRNVSIKDNGAAELGNTASEKEQAYVLVS